MLHLNVAYTLVLLVVNEAICHTLHAFPFIKLRLTIVHLQTFLYKTSVRAQAGCRGLYIVGDTFFCFLSNVSSRNLSNSMLSCVGIQGSQLRLMQNGYDVLDVFIPTLDSCGTSPPSIGEFGYICAPFLSLALPLDQAAERDAGKRPRHAFVCTRSFSC